MKLLSGAWGGLTPKSSLQLGWRGDLPTVSTPPLHSEWRGGRGVRPGSILTMALVGLAVLMLVFTADAAPVAAQGEFPLPPGVTWDDVNRVASQMYCDVCEGIPLDECESIACRQWREEIARPQRRPDHR
jgi:hypothetical protein